MDYKKLKQQLILHEGMKLKLYKCTEGKQTIGVGRNIEANGISEDEAMLMLRNDTMEALRLCVYTFKNFTRFPEKQQHALIDLMFNIGYNRFKGFKKMITAINKLDWKTAANEMKDSKWFKQVGNRGYNLVEMLRG